MPLTCHCDDYDDSAWFYYAPDDFTILKTKRSRRCKSCGILIKPGSDCIEIQRARWAQTEVEEKIYGCAGENEIVISSWYQCAVCGEQYLNLSALGYCVDPSENTLELLNEYKNINRRH